MRIKSYCSEERPCVNCFADRGLCLDAPKKELLDEEKRDEFEALARPLIRFLNENLHPHVHVMIDPRGAGIAEGLYAFTTEDYLVG